MLNLKSKINGKDSKDETTTAMDLYVSMCNCLDGFVQRDQYFCLSYAFCECSELTEVDIPSGVTNLGYRCFYGSGLQKIAIPASVTVADGDVLQNCSSLETIYFGGNKEQFEQIAGGLSWDFTYFGDDRNVTVNLLGEKVVSVG